MKERFVDANSEAEIEAIDKEKSTLADKDVDKFAECMLECIKETNKEADEVLLREKLESVLPSYLYLHYQRPTLKDHLNGSISA